MEQDSEFLILNSINELTRQKADISQRDLSRAINLSLGMTNVLLKRLSQQGYILMQKASPRNMSYVVTPEGMNELAKRTYRYLKRTMKKVVDYKESIVSITSDAHNRGYTHIGLLGASDIDFIIEYAARSVGLDYALYQDATAIPKDTFVFVSESYTGTCPDSGTAVARVYELLTGES